MIAAMTGKIVLLGVALLLAAGGLGAQETAQKVPSRITDPMVYIPLRESMTTMEMKFVDIQIMAAESKIDFVAVQRALNQMDASAKKIQGINPSEALREPLQQLSSQIASLKRNARRKDKAGLKADLDRVFEACFKCHQAHAPLTRSKEGTP